MPLRPKSALSAAIVGLGLVAAACADNESTEPAQGTEPVSSTDSGVTTTVTTTTAVGGSVPSEGESQNGQAPGSDFSAPLTGEPVGDAALARQRAMVVKVGNNNDRSRPQTGLVEADVVYEELIEGLKTRFMAVYHSETPDTVGPVRSGRTGDLELLADLGVPYFVYSGANTTVERELSRAEKAGDFIRVGALDTAEPFWRDPERDAPYNLYLLRDNFDATGFEVGAPPPAVEELFEYGDADASGVDNASGITVSYPGRFGRSSTHVWDDEAKGWVRIQDGTLHTAVVNGTEVEIAPANVVVVRVDYKRSEADGESPEAVSYGRGRAWVLTGGTVYLGTWERSEGQAGYRFYDNTGAAVTLAPGPTWILLANRSGPFPDSEVELLTKADAQRLLDRTRAAAG